MHEHYSDGHMLCGFTFPAFRRSKSRNGNEPRIPKKLQKSPPPELEDDDDDAFEACPMNDDFENEFQARLRGDGEKPELVEQLPPEATLNDMYKMQVMDRNRNKVFVKTLCRSDERRRHVIVFIRHFFCGMCYGYVKALADQLPPEKLAKMNPPTTLSIIGCGDPILIPAYVKETGCPYDLYADPSRQLYTKLGFAINTDPAPVKPDYVERYATTLLKNILVSAGLAVRSGKTTGGLISQNGGEMVWIDGQLRFIHRMKNSQDHTEVVHLIRLLRRQGIEMARKPTSVMSSGVDNGRGSKRNSWVRLAEKRLSTLFANGIPALASKEDLRSVRSGHSGS